MHTRIFKRSINQVVILAGVIPNDAVLWVCPSGGTPPHYQSFNREQAIDYGFEERDLLPVRVVFAGQGDGVLIQLRGKSNYNPDPDDGMDEGERARSRYGGEPKTI